MHVCLFCIRFNSILYFCRSDESTRLGTAAAGDESTRLGAAAGEALLGAASPSYQQTPAYAPSYAPSSPPNYPSNYAASYASNYGSYAPVQCPQNLLFSCQPSVRPVPCSSYYAPPSYSPSYDAAPAYRMPNLEMEEEEEEEDGLVGEPQQK